MRTETRESYEERIRKVLIHVQDHLDDELSLAELADIACFSPFHFHRIFSGMVGESVKEHVRRLRLERAALRLKHGRQPVVEIAFDAGYETHESFIRAFRAMFGCVPSEFRRDHRLPTYPEVRSGVHFHPADQLTDFGPRHSGGRGMEVQIKQVEPMRVAFFRHVGPFVSCEIGKAFQKLMMWAGPRRLCGPGTKVMSLCLDDPQVTPPDKLRLDACMTIPDDYKVEGGAGEEVIAGGEYAVTIHKGPYEKLHETYAALCGEWIPQSGRELASAPPFEIYHNNPQDTRPEDLITEIFMPLEPKK